MSAVQSNSKSESVYLTASQVCARFGGVSDMWLTRRLADGFPKPIHFGTKIRYFRLSDIVAWERAMIQRGCESSKPVPPRKRSR